MTLPNVPKSNMADVPTLPYQPPSNPFSTKGMASRTVFWISSGPSPGPCPTAEDVVDSQSLLLMMMLVVAAIEKNVLFILIF